MTAARNPYQIALVVSLAAFMEVLDTTIVNVAMGHIGGSFGASQDEATWVLTSYLVANGVVLPLSGWLAGVIGRKNYFLLSIIGFSLSSFACGVASSLAMLIACRLLQGLSGGGLQPIQMSIVMDAFPPEKRGAAFALTGITMIVAPIVGPTLGGYITDHFNWRWIFLMNVPVGVIAVALVQRMVSDPPHARAHKTGPIDYVGLLLIVSGLGLLQLVCDKGQEEDWFDSDFIVAATLGSAASLLAAVIWLWRREQPIVDLKLFLRPNFAMACVMVFFLGFALYASSALLPLLLQSEFGYDSLLAGLVLSPGGLAVVAFMPLVGRLVSQVQAKYLICLGMALLASGMAYTSTLTPQTDYAVFVAMRVTQVLGLPFLFIPSSTMAFFGIPPELSSKASALYSLLRNMGGSFGIAVVTSFVTRHQQLHQNVLVSQLNNGRYAYGDLLASAEQWSSQHGSGAAQAAAMARDWFYQMLQSQAAILAYCDGFRLMALVCACLVVFAMAMPLLPLAKSGAGPAH